MAETIIMVRVRLHAEDVKAAGAYARAVQDALSGLDGFQGLGVWQSVQDPLARLILFSYASEQAAESGLVAISARRSLVERQGKERSPQTSWGFRWSIPRAR